MVQNHRVGIVDLQIDTEVKFFVLELIGRKVFNPQYLSGSFG